MEKIIKLWFVAFAFALFSTFAACAKNFGATGLCDNEAQWMIERIDSADMIGLALDSFDNPHIVYANNPVYGPPALKYATYSGTEWTIELVHAASYTGYFPSIVLDSTDTPHVAWQDNTDSKLKYARHNPGAWAVETVESTGQWWAATSIAVDSMDSPRIVYFGIATNGMKFAMRRESGWTTARVDRGGEYLSIAQDLRVTSSQLL